MDIVVIEMIDAAVFGMIKARLSHSHLNAATVFASETRQVAAVQGMTIDIEWDDLKIPSRRRRVLWDGKLCVLDTRL